MKRIFIPIKWTAYQIDANYGHDPRKISKLDNFCKSIGGNRGSSSAHSNTCDRYFTVVQYDDGILAPIKNCRVFCAGGIGDDPIPLTTERHEPKGYKKKILASFLGSVSTNPIRKQMFDALKTEDMFIVEDVYTKKENMPRFIETTEKSCFTLCPRGYGKTSFRMYEAMQLGSVPVYISDEHWLPYTKFVDWKKISVLVRPDEIKNIPAILKKLLASGEYKVMAAAAKKAYDDYFSFESMFKWILKILEEEK